MSTKKILLVLLVVILIGAYWVSVYVKQFKRADIVVMNETNYRLVDVSVGFSTMHLGRPGALATFYWHSIPRGGKKLYSLRGLMTRPSSYTIGIDYTKYRRGHTEGHGSVSVPVFYVKREPGPVVFRILPGDVLRLEGPVTTGGLLSKTGTVD